MLIERGADVNARGGKFGSVIHAALASGNQAILSILLQNDALVSPAAAGRQENQD